jgi:hypothetical protein
MVEKDWPFERVWEEHERAREEDPGRRWTDPTLPLYRWEALHRLDALQRQFSEGDKFALMQAIGVCANHGLVMPKWVARGYIKGYYAVLNCNTDSWDGAFGRPYRKGFHLGKARLRRELRFAVRNRISEIRIAEPKTPIDDGLFERVGKEFGIGKTLCNRLYYEAERLIRSVFPET